MGADWCLTLGLVFQLCWHICVTAAELFTLRWLAGFSHYLWPKAMVECIQRIHKPSFISLKPTVILESVWITHDNNQKLLIWLLLFRESTLWPIIYTPSQFDIFTCTDSVRISDVLDFQHGHLWNMGSGQEDEKMRCLCCYDLHFFFQNPAIFPLMSHSWEAI